MAALLLLAIAALVYPASYFLCVFGAPLAMAYFAWLNYRWRQVKSFGIIKRDNQLIQTDNQGKETATITLNRPYTVDVSFKSFLKAIYTIKQNQTKVQFTSDTMNARYIAVDVLGVTKEWPPVGPWNFGW